jgi:hypothetical protein
MKMAVDLHCDQLWRRNVSSGGMVSEQMTSYIISVIPVSGCRHPSLSSIGGHLSIDLFTLTKGYFFVCASSAILRQFS